MIHPILKKKIEIRLGQKVLNRGDCELLSNLILETIDIEISYNTIRRLFGLAGNVKANKKTLNTLAKFVGYKNFFVFNDFVKIIYIIYILSSVWNVSLRGYSQTPEPFCVL